MVRFPAGLLLPLLAAALWAQPQASSSRPEPNVKSSLPDPGSISHGVYRNSALDFSYKLPFGWVDRTADMQDDTADPLKSRLLLAIFERPPEATGDTINSAVVIAAEPLPAGMKTPADYFESLAALTTAKGFQTAKEPQEIAVGAPSWCEEISPGRGAISIGDFAGHG